LVEKQHECEDVGRADKNNIKINLRNCVVNRILFMFQKV
jgi:hypothetical protein